MALVTLTKTPLFICRSRRSCRIFRGLGAISLILEATSGKLEGSETRRGDAPTNTNNEVDLRLCWDVEVTGDTGSPLQTDLLLLLGKILLHVGLGPLEDDLALRLLRLEKRSCKQGQTTDRVQECG